MALIVAAAGGASASRAFAQSSSFVPDPQTNPCAPNYASLTATRTFLNQGESTTLAWTVLVPANCAVPMVYLRTAGTGQSMPVDAVDGTTVTPLVTTTYVIGTQQLNLAQITITVGPPSQGAALVTITANNQQALFVQALSSPNTEVQVQEHVELDLSAYYAAIPIAQGVRLRGTRGGRQRGARLYLRPDADRADGEPLFRVIGNEVSISGLRIDGGHDGSSGPSRIGISGDSRRALSIFRNEIYGWAITAVELSDMEVPGGFASAPVIDSNDFHHNPGHGVYLFGGAIAEIHANVFDGPGLALGADGAGSGYSAWQNLVLAQSGGFEAAGMYFAVGNNAFSNASGPAFLLRGTAPAGAFVHDNTYGGPGAFPHEYVGTGLVATDNDRRAAEQGACDFDGDGREDLLLTTGRTWWVDNGGDRGWAFLPFVSQPTLMLSEVSLGDVTGDGRCDVFTDAVVLYTTDRSPTQSPGPTSRLPQ